MKTLLVPVDFTPVSQTVLRAAAEFSRALSARLVLVHVLVPAAPLSPDYALPLEPMQQTLALLDATARQRLDRLVARLQKRGLRVSGTVRTGLPDTEIVAEAARAKASYILLGSHGHGRLYDLFLGSTSNRVAKKAKCGVIIVPAH